MKVYGTPAEALEDAMRLAGAMTLKMAGIDVPFGGARPFSRSPARSPTATAATSCPTASSSTRSAAPIAPGPT